MQNWTILESLIVFDIFCFPQLVWINMVLEEHLEPRRPHFPTVCFSST